MIIGRDVRDPAGPEGYNAYRRGHFYLMALAPATTPIRYAHPSFFGA
jgi:hypothetical protein